MPMFDLLKKLQYGARVFLSRGGGEPETIDISGRPTVIMQGGKGPPLVYLHSSVGEAFMWFPFYQTLAKEFQVFVPTHPGFGKSGGFDQIDDIHDMVFHYVELFDTLGLGEIILGGVSLGGWIAAEFASLWPERVKKLWIADAPGLWVDEEPLPDLFRYMQDRTKIRELLFHDPKGHMATMLVQDNPDEERMMSAYQNMTVLARLVWERPYNPRLPRRLKRLERTKCPVLLLWGEQDKLVPPSYGRAYHKCIPWAEMKLIPNCGHLPMFEREAEFVDALSKFCRT
jgi:pimeloyl-ACP methyl ester carboxylesterase